MSDPIRDARFGRIKLPTVFDALQEAVGDTLEAVGAGVVPGERRPRSFNIPLPLRGHAAEANPYEYGEKVRRQIRSLMENTPAKMRGIYFAFVPDPELDGWLIVGAGTISYDEGGITTGSFKLELGDAYRVGTRRTHRAARRAELYDRRLATTPRDILGTVFSADFADLPALPLIYLPVGATDITGVYRRPKPHDFRASLGGNVIVLPGVVHGEVVSFEWAPAAIHAFDDIVIYDRRGRVAPPSPFQIRVLQSLPVAYWRLGESAGATQMRDAGPNQLHGSYVGPVELGVSSPLSDPDTAAGFRGADGAYGRVADAAALDITSDLTIAGWVKPYGAGGTSGGTAGASPSFRSSSTASGNAVGSTLTINKPAGVAQGDLMLAHFEVSGLGSATCAPPAGWTQLHRVSVTDAVGNSHVDFLFWKLAGASEGASYSWILNGGAGNFYWGGAIGAYQDCDQTTPINVSAMAAQADSTTPSTPSVTPTVAGCRLVAVCGHGRNATITAPAGMTERWNQSGGSTTGRVEGADELQAVAAAVTRQFTIGTSAPSSTGMVALAPVAGSTAGYDSLLSKWRSVASGRSYRFGYDAGAHELALELSSNGTAVARATVPVVLTPDTWVHLAVVYEAGAGRARFYRNGTQLGEATGLPTSVFASTTQLTIGKWESDA